MNIKELLLNQAEIYPQKPAVIFQNQPVSFLKLKEISFKIANYFIGLGIEKDDKIVVFMPNICEAVYSFLGVFSAGAVLVPLDFLLTEEEVINCIKHSEAEVFITLPKKGVDLFRVQKACPCLREIIVCQEKIDGFSFWPDIVSRSEDFMPNIDIDEENLGSIFYTSGSTGHPKGVALSYKNFDAPIQCIAHYLTLSSEDTIVCPGMPFSHLGGLDYILLMLYFGQTLILMERFHPLEFLKNIEQYKVALFWIVPSMYIALLSLKEFDKFNLSSLRYAVVFGAPSSPVLLKRFHKTCPEAHLINGWGMTETSAPNCFLPPGIDKIESVGKFSPGMEAKIVDEKGNSLNGKEEGELWVRGKGVMKGYYKEPCLTADVLTSDGWLKTGDIAKVDEQGLYYIVGRKKDMIKVAGEVVFSSEVEEKIAGYPKVKEVAVIGVFDKLRGEVPKAFIVPQHGQELVFEELKEFLKQHLAHFKIPHYFECVNELPKNRVGKIEKSVLKSKVQE